MAKETMLSTQQRRRIEQEMTQARMVPPAGHVLGVERAARPLEVFGHRVRGLESAADHVVHDMVEDKPGHRRKDRNEDRCNTPEAIGDQCYCAHKDYRPGAQVHGVGQAHQ